MVYAGEKTLFKPSRYIEKTGPWYFPPIASLITSGGRLLLAMLEQCVRDAGGTYLFCDTDSMCIVASEKGELVPCVGGSRKVEGQDAIQALSIKQVEAITKKFNNLNPYNPKFVKEILKIEDVNHVDGDTKNPRHRLMGYAIAAKRYALYTQTERNISVVKASGHGLGFLFAPKKIQPDEKSKHESDEDVPQWVVEAWDWLIHREFELAAKNPAWLGLPAMMRMAVTSPNVMRHNRPEWLAPFNFFLFPMISELGGYPPGIEKKDFKFIVPFETDRSLWSTLRGINLKNEKVYRIAMLRDGKRGTVVPESFRIILRQYLQHPEAKSLAPDGSVCRGTTQGLLRRETITARKLAPIGKETDRSWEQGEDPSILDFRVKEFGNESKLAIAEPTECERWRKLGIRLLMRKSGLSQKTVYAILGGEPVRRTTLSNFIRAADGQLAALVR